MESVPIFLPKMESVPIFSTGRRSKDGTLHALMKEELLLFLKMESVPIFCSIGGAWS